MIPMTVSFFYYYNQNKPEKDKKKYSYKMGNSEGSQEKRLSDENIGLIVDVFKKIDADGNEQLDMSELLDWWGQNYPTINARAIVYSIDEIRDGIITLREWISFWEGVKENGVSNKQIRDELKRLMQKESWSIFG